MKVETLEKSVEIPEGIEISTEGSRVTIKGPKGEISRDIKNPKVTIKKDNSNVVLSAKNATKREKKEVKVDVNKLSLGFCEYLLNLKKKKKMFGNAYNNN